MTPLELARVFEAGMGTGDPALNTALAAMIVECEAIGREQATYEQPPVGSAPLPPYAEHQSTPDGQYHRVTVWFAGDLAQAQHFTRWFNRGDWAAYERWYHTLDPAPAPESNAPQSSPPPPTDEPRWPVLPPPSSSAPGKPFSPYDPARMRHGYLGEPDGSAPLGGTTVTMPISQANAEILTGGAGGGDSADRETVALSLPTIVASPAGIDTLFTVKPPTEEQKQARAKVYHEFVPRQAGGGWFCRECDGTEWADQHHAAGVRREALKRVNGT